MNAGEKIFIPLFLYYFRITKSSLLSPESEVKPGIAEVFFFLIISSGNAFLFFFFYSTL